MDHREGGGGLELRDEIAVGDGVEAVGRDRGKSQIPRDGDAVERKSRSGAGARAERRDGRAAAAVRQPREVPQQHLGVGVERVREKNRLRGARVGAGRHDDALGERHLRPIEERETQAAQRLLGARGRFERPEAQIQSDLVVAGSPGVHAPSGLAGERDQAPLDVQVNVLVRVLEKEPAAGDLTLDRLQPALDPRERALRKESGSREPARVGPRSGDVLRGEPSVEGVRHGELREGASGLARVTASPEGSLAFPPLHAKYAAIARR